MWSTIWRAWQRTTKNYGPTARQRPPTTSSPLLACSTSTSPSASRSTAYTARAPAAVLGRSTPGANVTVATNKVVAWQGVALKDVSQPPPPPSAHPAPRYKSKHDSSSSSNTTTKKTSERARVRGRAPYLAALGLTQLLVAKPKRKPLSPQQQQPPSGRGAPVFSPEGGASGRAYGQQHATQVMSNGTEGTLQTCGAHEARWGVLYTWRKLPTL